MSFDSIAVWLRTADPYMLGVVALGFWYLNRDLGEIRVELAGMKATLRTLSNGHHMVQNASDSTA